MIFKRITVRNFLCYLGTHTVELTEGVTVVVADYDGAEKRSNRGGKSAIAVDAPQHALFGTVRTGKADDLCHRAVAGEEDCWAEVEVLTSNGETFTIRQGRTAAGKAIRQLDGANVKEADLEELVTDRVLGLNEREYELTNAFVQGDMHAFMKLGPVEKRRTISPWFKTDRWIPRAALARERLNEAKAELRAAEEEANSLIDADPEAAGEKVREAEAEETRLRKEHEKVNTRLFIARADAGNLDEMKDELADARRNLRKAERQLEDENDEARSAARRAQRFVDECEQKVEEAEIRDRRLAALDGAEQRLQDALEHQTDLKTQIGNLNNEATRLETIRSDLLATHAKITENRTGICPLLQEPCDRVARDQTEVRKVLTEGRGIKAKLAQILKNVEEIPIREAESEVQQARRDLQGAERLRKQPGIELAKDTLKRAREGQKTADARLVETAEGNTPAKQLVDIAEENYSKLVKLVCDSLFGNREWKIENEQLNGDEKTRNVSENITDSDGLTVSEIRSTPTKGTKKVARVEESNSRSHSRNSSRLRPIDVGIVEENQNSGSTELIAIADTYREILSVAVGGVTERKALIQFWNSLTTSEQSLIIKGGMNEVEDLDGEARALKVRIDTQVRDVSRLKADEEIHRRAAERSVELEEIRRQLWNRVADLTWTHYAFSAVGIPSREIENAFGVAEAAMNNVLEGMGTRLRVRFSPTRELKDWEPACLACGTKFAKGERKHVCLECGVPRAKKRRDELRMEVLDGDRISSFSADSGGGKVLLSMGVRFGLARLPGMVRATRCEHALIDEPDGMLDDPNRDALHRLLRERLGMVGIRQAILVTHAPVREEFDNVIEITRYEDEDRSEVRS